MKVLVWLIDADAVPGGHRVQAEQTCRALRRMGVEAQISFCESADPGEYDLVHGFGLPASQIRRCRRAGVPVVLSPLYCGLGFVGGVHIPMSLLRATRHRLRMGGVLMRDSLRGRHLRKCMAIAEPVTRLWVAYEMADALLPNSQAEAEAIKADLGVTTPCYIVPNGVDPEIFSCSEDKGGRDGVVYVGRFEPHKNQLGLIRATRGSSLKLTLVGPAHPHHFAYYERCRQEAGEQANFIGAVAHDQLSEIYRRAKVHVLPSWFETTGLASLEAGMCGCSVVTTSRGYAREYFCDKVWYCDPDKPKTIRDAVMAAHEAPQGNELREHIQSCFTWRHVALSTLEVYERVLAGGRRTMRKELV